ncbi:MAG: hypothetical protein NT033_03710 [Candidatus Omnitrophica bacterium]|nr:hypothetical protein [Candidatus Omnitrophota bacterium]
MKNKLFVSMAVVVILILISILSFKGVAVSGASLEAVRNYHKQGKVAEVIKEANEYLKSDPKNTEALIILGENYAKKSDFISSEKTLKKAIDIQPKNSWAVRALANTYNGLLGISVTSRDKDKYGRLAKTEIEKALTISADDPWVNRDAAGIYYMLNDKEKATQAIEKALKLIPEDNYARNLYKNIQSMPEKKKLR